MGKKIGIITGASSGMGREFVRQLDGHLCSVEELWVIARRKTCLEELAATIRIPVRIFALDLCQEAALQEFTKVLEQEQPEVRLLINAAGVGRAGFFMELEQKTIENMLAVNVQALVTWTYCILPYMGNPSNILQMASASAFLPQLEFAVYAASKAFVLSFSRALRAEVKEKGIVVTIVCPGPVDTEFLELCNNGKPQKPLKKLTTVRPEQVVTKALRDAKAGREVSVYGLPMKVVRLAAKVLPNRWFL